MLTRTKAALGKNLMEKLSSLHFCIVGCGGTGATFAEMLVRSGARNIDLVDGEDIDSTNLNRVFSFVSADVDNRKVNILKKRLKLINPETNVLSFEHHLISEENTVPGNYLAQEVRNRVREADVVFIGTDTNESRITCEGLCRNKKGKVYLSVGIHVEDGKSFFECNWRPKTPEARKDARGYGPENASYISIVTEATCIAFSMLLHRLKNPESKKFRKYYREYDGDFMISKTKWD